MDYTRLIFNTVIVNDRSEKYEKNTAIIFIILPNFYLIIFDARYEINNQRRHGMAKMK